MTGLDKFNYIDVKEVCLLLTFIFISYCSFLTMNQNSNCYFRLNLSFLLEMKLLN